MALLNMAMAAFYVFLLLFAAVSDFRELRIPNWISLALVALFAGYAGTIGWHLNWLQHVGVAVATFVGGLVIYVMRWFSAGDVKLLAAVALWAGPSEILPVIFVTTVAGAALAAMVLALKKLPHLFLFGRVIMVDRFVPRWARHGLLPYGIGISVGALLLVPIRFQV